MVGVWLTVYMCVCVCAAELTCTDNNGASAWDYARARQLHYCMLIIASYLRQRSIKAAADSLSQTDCMSTRYLQDFNEPHTQSLLDSQQLQVTNPLSTVVIVAVSICCKSCAPVMGKY